MSTTSPSQSKSGRARGARNEKTNGSLTAVDTTNGASAEATASARPSEELIAQRAYEIYQQGGCQPGSELQNWLQAEAELTAASKH